MYFRLLAIIVTLTLTPLCISAKESTTPNKPHSTKSLKAKIKKQPTITKIAKKTSKTHLSKEVKVIQKVRNTSQAKISPSPKPSVVIKAPAPIITVLKPSTTAPSKYISNMDDEPTLLQIVRLSSNQQWFDASELAQKCNDPTFANSMVKILKIYYAPQSLSVKETSDFFNENKWIPLDPFAVKIEKAISYDNTPGSVMEWFKSREPQTNSGKFSLLHSQILTGGAKLDDGDTKRTLRELWRTTEFDLNTEEYYLKKYKDHLTIEDLLKKIEFLTWNKSYTYANELLNILPPQYRKLPKTRLEIAQSRYNLQRTLSGASEHTLKDDYIQYTLINTLLDNDKESAALQKLLEIKPKAGFDKWWKLKNIAIRNALRDRSFEKAYALTVDHRLEYGADMAEAEWLGGWISLRFLNNPDQAIKRFETLYNNTKLASSKSKGAYWLARSFEALGDTNNSNTWYTVASQYKGTFYGHLAIATQHSNDQYNYFENTAHATDKHTNYEHKERAKKLTYFAYLLHKADIKFLANNLLASIADLDLDRSDLEISALYFINRKYYPLAVEIAKSSSNKGAPLLREGYPRHIEVSGNNLPKGIYLGIIRQESLFDPNALSPAGARGLMQLMPATASKMSRILGLPKEAFASDPASNVRQGVTYFDHLHKQYSNIPMSIAAYNAGPGNVAKWVSRYGDPRKSHDPYVMIDWIESIPFNETRNYVKKVIENYVVYDSILDDNHAPKAILSFLEN